MFSTCRSLQTGLILLALGACSKEPAPAQAPSTPLVAAVPQAQQRTKAVVDTLEARIDAAGLAASYRATFEGNERVRIDEQRVDGRNGLYEFRGARLLHYSGEGLRSTNAIELEFDLNGALKSSQAGTATVPAEEITAIRERAQLLRSHALTRRTTRDHQ